MGFKDGEVSNAMFNHPRGVAFDEDTGDVYVSDSLNNIIRKITPQGSILIRY